MPQFISRISMTGAQPAPIVSGPAPAIGGALIYPPGKYSYNGIVYDLTEQGFYSIVNAGHLGAFDGGPKVIAASGASCDVERLMESCAWSTRYGRSDEGYTPAQLTANVIRLRSAALRCGKTIEWARSVCTGLGVQSRTVHLLTADAFNGFDDGHVAMEVFHNGGWRFYDVAGDVTFRNPVADPQGFPRLSANAVINAGVSNVLTERLAHSESAPTDWGANKFATEQYYHMALRFNADAWRARIYQCLGMVATNGQIWWKLPLGSPPDLAQRVEALSTAYKVKDPAFWDTTFYP